MRIQPTTRQTVLFPDLLDKPIVAKFDQTHGSSDGGAILLKSADHRLRLSEQLAACLREIIRLPVAFAVCELPEVAVIPALICAWQGA